MHFYDWSSTMGWGAMGLGALWMVLWWLLPILGIVALVSWIARAEGRRPEKTARDILKERYARGEIDQEEFHKKMHDIEGR